MGEGEEVLSADATLLTSLTPMSPFKGADVSAGTGEDFEAVLGVVVVVVVVVVTASGLEVAVAVVAVAVPKAGVIVTGVAVAVAGSSA